MAEKKDTPIYWQSAAYARENGERDAYFASKKANIACRDAIEKAVSEHYSGSHLDTDAILDAVVPEHGYERVLLVLAATIRERDWDDRFSRDSKSWAKMFRLPLDKDPDGYDRYTAYAVKQTHSCLLDSLVSYARCYLPKYCYGILPSTNELVIIKRNESEYAPVDYIASGKVRKLTYANRLNAQLGVSKAQAAAMLAGATQGWFMPDADPQNYDKDGKLLRSKRGARDVER